MSDIAVLKEESIPERLGRYSIIQSLAKGGMAQVFVAQKDGAEDICVLKQLLVELEEHETASKRFHREAHVASYLIHPNIARVTDAGMQDDTFCIAMEFIAGTDVETMMHNLMREGRMLPHEVSLAVVIGALNGLAYAHEALDPAGKPLGLVHRDLSPRNIMLSFEGDVKLIDFGLAHGKLDDFKTAPGMILGTLRYVSPEQAMTGAIDRRSDIYSLAVVLFEMLTGRFLVQHGKPLDVLKTVIAEKAPPLSSLNPNLPPALDAVLAKGLEKEADARWQTAAEFRDAVLEAAGSLADTPKALLGDFVQQLFPKEQEEARALLALGRRRFGQGRRSMSASTLSEDDLHSATRGMVSPQELGDPNSDGATRTGYLPDADDAGSITRTAMVGPSAMSGVDLDAPTRAGMVEPVPFDSLADLGMSTQTALIGDETMVATRVGDPAETSTAVIRSRNSSQLGALPIAHTIPPDPLVQPVLPDASRSTGRIVAIVAAAVVVLGLGIGIGRLTNDSQPPLVRTTAATPAEIPAPSNPGAVGAVASRTPEPAGAGAQRAKPGVPAGAAPNPGAAEARTPKPATAKPATPGGPKPAKSPPPSRATKSPTKTKPPPPPARSADPGPKSAKAALFEIKKQLDGYELSPAGNRVYSGMLKALRQVAGKLPPDRAAKAERALKTLELCLDSTCFNGEAYHENTKKAYQAVRSAASG